MLLSATSAAAVLRRTVMKYRPGHSSQAGDWAEGDEQASPSSQRAGFGRDNPYVTTMDMGYSLVPQ